MYICHSSELTQSVICIMQNKKGTKTSAREQCRVISGVVENFLITLPARSDPGCVYETYARARVQIVTLPVVYIPCAHDADATRACTRTGRNACVFLAAPQCGWKVLMAAGNSASW